MAKKTTEQFIKQAKAVHGDKYDYSKTNYTSSKDKVCIICSEHGEFWQLPSEHLRGHGCDKCSGSYSLTTDDFIKRAREVHGDKYDYSKTEYVNSKTKVCIICPEHGEFWQRPQAHLNGRGCRKCHGSCDNTEDFIYNARKVHGDKYDYSKVNYINSTTEVTIICPIHGEFEQKPVKHLRGHGCYKCGNENRRNKQFLTQEEFIKKARDVHGDKYDYSETVYTSMDDDVYIICHKKNKKGEEHGGFWQSPSDHLSGHGCRKCGYIISIGEDEIYEHLSKHFDQSEIMRNDRKVLNGKEIDILFPKLNIGIEYNGLKWHSEEFGRDYKYHIEKTEECNKNGVDLIQIFEDEYLKYKKQTISKIEKVLGIEENKEDIDITKCYIKEISKEEVIGFIKQYDICECCKYSRAYACIYNNEVVSIMTFIERRDNKWEIAQTIENYKYKGSKHIWLIFNYFIESILPKQVTMFINRRWATKNYIKEVEGLGFKLDGISKPNYYYVNITKPNGRIQKGELRKRSFRKKYGLERNLTETQMAKEIGLSKIWDCGLYRYIWKMEDK